MRPRLVKLGPADYQTAQWSGGTTTQLAIFPSGAKYQDRAFLWRVSSATVELESSVFTELPDYQRMICTLKGEIALSHNGGSPIRLSPFQVHAFSGADQTKSEGRCTDFNLMLRREEAEGQLRAIRVGDKRETFRVEAAEQFLLYCAEGSCAVCFQGGRETLAAGECLTTERPMDEGMEFSAEAANAASTAALILCRMRRI